MRRPRSGGGGVHTHLVVGHETQIRVPGAERLDPTCGPVFEHQCSPVQAACLKLEICLGRPEACHGPVAPIGGHVVAPESLQFGRKVEGLRVARVTLDRFVEGSQRGLVVALEGEPERFAYELAVDRRAPRSRKRLR